MASNAINFVVLPRTETQLVVLITHECQEALKRK